MTTCPICGEFDADDASDAHDACDLAEMEDWNRGFGVTYTGEEHALGDDLEALKAAGRSLVRFVLTVAGSGLLVGIWVARKFTGRDRV